MLNTAFLTSMPRAHRDGSIFNYWSNYFINVFLTSICWDRDQLEQYWGSSFLLLSLTNLKTSKAPLETFFTKQLFSNLHNCIAPSFKCTSEIFYVWYLHMLASAATTTFYTQVPISVYINVIVEGSFFLVFFATKFTFIFSFFFMNAFIVIM